MRSEWQWFEPEYEVSEEDDSSTRAPADSAGQFRAADTFYKDGCAPGPGPWQFASRVVRAAEVRQARSSSRMRALAPTTDRRSHLQQTYAPPHRPSLAEAPPQHPQPPPAHPQAVAGAPPHCATRGYFRATHTPLAH